MRLPSDPVARLAKLEATRPNVEPGEILNAEEMAAAAGMVWKNLKAIVDRDPDFPVLRRGGEGTPWQFEAAKALDHMIDRARAVQADRERRRDRVSVLAGLGSETGGGSPSGGDGQSAGSGSAARDMFEDARALSALIDVQAKLRAEKVAQGALLHRDKVESFLWRWLSALQSDVLAIEGRIDKVGMIEPVQREAIKAELATALVSLRGALEREIGKWNAPGHR